MDWLMFFVMIAIIGQYVLIKWFIHKYERHLKQTQRQHRAEFFESASDKQTKTYLNNLGAPNE